MPHYRVIIPCKSLILHLGGRSAPRALFPHSPNSLRFVTQISKNTPNLRHKNSSRLRNQQKQNYLTHRSREFDLSANLRHKSAPRTPRTTRHHGASRHPQLPLGRSRNSSPPPPALEWKLPTLLHGATPLEEQPNLNSAILALEDGTVFEGRSFGAPAERSGEVVFNTALTGYQEVFTDPSYSGQIVILTNPQIGNYGTSVDDNESARPYIEGLVVREFSAIASNWRSDTEADDFLGDAGVPIVSRPRHARAGAPSAHPRRDARRASRPSKPTPASWSRRRARSPPWPGSIWPAA